MNNIDIWDTDKVLREVNYIESYIASIRSHCSNLADLNTQLSGAWASDSPDKKSYLANSEKIGKILSSIKCIRLDYGHIA